MSTTFFVKNVFYVVISNIYIKKSVLNAVLSGLKVNPDQSVFNKKTPNDIYVIIISKML